jgi:hypothetical protein
MGIKIHFKTLKSPLLPKNAVHPSLPFVSLGTPIHVESNVQHEQGRSAYNDSHLVQGSVINPLFEGGTTHKPQGHKDDGQIYGKAQVGIQDLIFCETCCWHWRKVKKKVVVERNVGG